MTSKKNIDSLEVGVVGAGVIGRGVAQTVAESGHTVILVDCSHAALESAEVEVRRQLRFARLLKARSFHEDATIVMQRILFTEDYSKLSTSDIVVENVTEDWTVKRGVFKLLDDICSTAATFASNTSAIAIGRLAALSRSPQRVIGTHFMNPVPMKPTVEVIRAAQTSDETVASTQAFITSLGKDSVVVNDSPGFVSNRVFMLTINEAIHLVQEEVASAADIDLIFKTCMGHKMGPLETADLIGLDTVLNSLRVLQDSFAGDKFEPCVLLCKMVDSGQCGRKTGHGFYSYKTDGTT